MSDLFDVTMQNSHAIRVQNALRFPPHLEVKTTSEHIVLAI